MREGDSTAIGAGLPGVAYLAAGWGRSGKSFVSIGPLARLQVPVTPIERDTTLTLTLRAFIERPVVARQRLAARINGRAAAEWETDSSRLQVLEIPVRAEDMRSGRLDVELSLPDNVCPACVGLGGEQRSRAIELTGIALGDVSGPTLTE